MNSIMDYGEYGLKKRKEPEQVGWLAVVWRTFENRKSPLIGEMELGSCRPYLIGKPAIFTVVQYQECIPRKTLTQGSNEPWAEMNSRAT
jgi:hypothetical protein